MARFFLAPTQWHDLACLDSEESRHCLQVLRFGVGDRLTVFDGKGRSASAEIVRTERSAVHVRLGAASLQKPSCPQITLALAVPKGKTMDWIVEKAVELGASRVQPLITRHTVVQCDAAEARKKAEKWQRVALEACKQCGQNWLPQVDAPQPWATWLADRASVASWANLDLMASLTPTAQDFRHTVQSALHRDPSPQRITVLVGPEGDFSAEETQQALASGFRAVTLGPIVLRCETAALMLLSALRYETL